MIGLVYTKLLSCVWHRNTYKYWWMIIILWGFFVFFYILCVARPSKLWSLRNRQLKRVLYLYHPLTPHQWGALLTQEVLRAEWGQPVVSGQIGDQSPHQPIFNPPTCQADCICNSRTGEREAEVNYVGYTITDKREEKKNSKGWSQTILLFIQLIFSTIRCRARWEGESWGEM